MGPQNSLRWLSESLPRTLQPTVLLHVVSCPLSQVLLHPQNIRNLRIMFFVQKQSKQTLSDQLMPALRLKRFSVPAHGRIQQRTYFLHADKWVVEVWEHAAGVWEEVHWKCDWECALCGMQAVKLVHLQVRVLWESRASAVCVHSWMGTETGGEWEDGEWNCEAAVL